MNIIKNDREKRLSRAIVIKNYIGRFILYLIFLIPIIPELSRQDAHHLWWVYIVSFLLLYPHIAFLLAYRSSNPAQVEQRNMIAEGFFEGTLYVGLSFSLAPMLAFFTIGIMYIGFYGGLKLFIKSRLFLIAGILLGILIFGFNPDFNTGQTSIIASSVILPLIVLGLVISIRNDYNKSRAKIQKNKDHLEELASKLAKYLSPQVYNQIFIGNKEVRLESYRKKLTVFFSDIKGFTTLTDSMESEALSSLLNGYFDEMAAIALRHGGTIDKYMGDAIMIFFGDPESNGEKEDACACVLMALEMREKLLELREKWSDEGITQELHIRMGINTGFCTVGNFGSEDRLDYTIVGGQVNLASRLESNADVDQILISEETFVLVKEIVLCEKKDEITVKGLPRPVQTYQVNSKKDIVKQERIFKNSKNGFSIEVDFDQINKENALVELKRLVAEIEERNK